MPTKKKHIYQEVDKLASLNKDVCTYLWDNPEVGGMFNISAFHNNSTVAVYTGRTEHKINRRLHVPVYFLRNGPAYSFTVHDSIVRIIRMPVHYKSGCGQSGFITFCGNMINKIMYMQYISACKDTGNICFKCFIDDSTGSDG